MPKFMIMLTGAFSQIVMPVILFVCKLWLFVSYPLYYAHGLTLIIRIFYFLLIRVWTQRLVDGSMAGNKKRTVRRHLHMMLFYNNKII